MELTKRKVVCDSLSFLYILFRGVIDSLLASMKTMKTKVTYKIKTAPTHLHAKQE